MFIRRCGSIGSKTRTIALDGDLSGTPCCFPYLRVRLVMEINDRFFLKTELGLGSDVEAIALHLQYLHKAVKIFLTPWQDFGNICKNLFHLYILLHIIKVKGNNSIDFFKKQRNCQFLPDMNDGVSLAKLL